MGNTGTDLELVSTDEASKIAGVSVATINRWTREGRLTPAFQGNGVRGPRAFRRSDVEALS